jgi:molybdopterin-guanine dinucleotide biosynthesis protein B
MISAVSIVGKSNSGKTTLIEKLIRELKKRGYRVATIKHNRHGFDIDHEGKDSWRHKKAGAQITVIASPIQVAVIEDTERDYEISELIENYIHDNYIAIASDQSFDIGIPAFDINDVIGIADLIEDRFLKTT